ncbi:MAG: gliding motility-associated C-terminal domain-containing protein [Lewinellaceae bacterium]|nr:gliding motility-associated C-terminal domain-containing protein [Saprospiraceae bacterium]MCB9329620.1 gliding motility-associated C-terminal domain-containing protein [Lewinellaceae bacterium]
MPNGFAQCGQTINTFPYFEDFESDPGGWITSGLNNDWAWGIPAKPTINTAGSGTRCWITGGLSGSFYNLGQRSYVESPCFDFTTLSHPYISFKIWWESERQYDGANFQYSLNDGTTWTNVGAAADPVDCLNENWFNSTSITHLSNLAQVRDGWAGNIKPTVGSCLGGGGSNGWVTARHCMPYLANEPNVKFRFAFGAGTTCNDFDGIAFDAIRIENAPPLVADFEVICISSDTFRFTSLVANCPDTWSWGFNDPDSGPFNTSTEANPIHVFTKPGIYTVTMQASSDCSPSSSISHTVRVLGLNTNSTPADCFGNSTGSATVQAIPGGSTPSFAWSTSPTQFGPTASNLSAGTYTVTMTEPGSCSATATVTISEPAPLQYSASVQPAYCGNPTGSASIQVSGGIGPYGFTWFPQGGSMSNATNLPVGDYIVSISDQNSCLDTAHIRIDSTGIVAELASKINASCHGAMDGQIQIQVTAGTPPYTYIWSAGAGNNQTAENLIAGSYSLTISDANACTTSLVATVDEPALLTFDISTVPVRCFGNTDGVIRAESVSGGTPPYSFSLGQSAFGGNPVFENLAAGKYVLSVQDANGCLVSDTATVLEPGPNPIQAGPDTTIVQGEQVQLIGTISDPGRVIRYQWEPSAYLACDSCLKTLAHPPETTTFTLTAIDSSGCIEQAIVEIKVEAAPLYLPNAFKPDSESPNDRFTIFAGTSVQQVELMQVYDRWGNLLFENQNFQASDPAEGWDGKANGKDASPGIYVYFIKLKLVDSTTITKKGGLVLIR